MVLIRNKVLVFEGGTLTIDSEGKGLLKLDDDLTEFEYPNHVFKLEASEVEAIRDFLNQAVRVE